MKEDFASVSVCALECTNAHWESILCKSLSIEDDKTSDFILEYLSFKYGGKRPMGNQFGLLGL